MKKMADKYNSELYSFSITENKLNNLLNEWKKYNNKFNKFSIFENQRNYDGEIILKKYTFQYIACEGNKDRKLIENIIWVDDANISRIRESKKVANRCDLSHPKRILSTINNIF